MRRLLPLLLLVLFVAPIAIYSATLININTADSAALQTLNGIGPSKAQAIIDYRIQHGPFAKIEDIQNVSGIGTVTYGNIKDFITVGDTQTTQSQTTSTTTQQSTQSEQQSPQSTPVSSYVPPPAPVLFVDAGQDRTVIVGADSVFEARAYNKNRETIQDNVRFAWNFGDGSTAEGRSILHHFAYPGRYVVVVDIANNRDAASDEVIVTAEPAKLAFEVLSDGSVSIKNIAGRDLDLSGWIVRSFNQFFTLPARSKILTGSAMHISHETLKFFASATTELDYPNGAFALAAGGASVQKTEPVTAAAKTPLTVIEKSPAPAAQVEEATSATEEYVSTTTQVAVAASAASGGTWWWFGAGALALLGGSSVYAMRRIGKNEWDIVDASE